LLAIPREDLSLIKTLPSYWVIPLVGLTELTGLVAAKDALSSLMDITTYLPEVELENSTVDKGRLLLTGSTSPLYKRASEAFLKWTKRIPDKCTTDGLDVSMMIVGQQLSLMPFYGVDCPEACENICENYRGKSRSYLS